MASAYSPLFAVSTPFQRISALLTWFLVFSQVDAQNRSSEVDILSNFAKQMHHAGIFDDQYGRHGEFSNSEGYWSTWKDTDDSPCAWKGVLCNNATSTVERLVLSGWGLQYMLPSWEPLSGLRDLRELDLSSNDFGAEDLWASIPRDIQTLSQLTRLDLSRNNHLGTIPPNTSACRNLQFISLELNQLSGEIPSLATLVNLQTLLLADNQLTGEFPELGQINSLVTIDLSDNMLNNTIPSLSNLTNLLHLKIDNNKFTTFEGPLFPGLKSLEHLSVSGNQLEGAIPSDVTKLPNLKILNMSSNRLSGDIPSKLNLLQQPDNTRPLSFTLDLSDNQLSGSISASLLQLGQVMSVNLSRNSLTGRILFNGAALDTWYGVLDLSHNHLSGPIPSFFTSNNVAINSLCLQNNKLSGDIVDLLLASGRTSSALEITLAELRMGNNLFTGDLSRFASINNSVWPNLEVVDFSNNNLQMSTTGATDPLSGILEYFMGSTFYPGNPATTLRELYLGGNNFSGVSLPAYFPGYTNHSQSVEVLDLSNSHLKGKISDSIFNSNWLPALRSLNLSNNDATGPIPESIFMLPNLTVLDVTHNDLSGPLPSIPPNSRLYNPTFYANNGGLCGGPLPPCPQGNSTKWWVWIIVSGSAIIALGSCLATTWKWRDYHKKHQQDADLIKTLLDRESTALMSLSELRKATNNFSESEKIGEGGFGIVYKGELNDGTIVAIKKSKREGAEIDKQQFLNEVRILSQVNHRNLVKLLGCCMENKVALLVFEFVSNGSLEEHLHGKIGGTRLTWSQRLRIAVQTADGLHYLHSAATFPIYHRDVKSANILLDIDLNAKVADFGISRLVPLQATHVSTVVIQGTIGYIDPEYYTCLQLTDKSDVYSFGVVLLELLSSRHALDFSRGEGKISLVTFALEHIKSGDLQKLLDPALMETYNDPTGHGRESILNVGRLAMKCLDIHPRARPSMNEVWKGLQNLKFEFEGTSQQLGSVDEVRQHDCHLDILSESFFGNSSNSVTLHNDGSGIQMSHVSIQPGHIRSRSC